MAQRPVLEGEEESDDDEGEDERDAKGNEDEGEDLIYQPEELQDQLFASEDQPYDVDIQDENNQPIIIPSRGLDFAEDSNGEISEEEYDDSQTAPDWREGVDDNEMVGNAVYVPEDNQDLEDLPEEDQEKAWLELQQVNLTLQVLATSESQHEELLVSIHYTIQYNTLSLVHYLAIKLHPVQGILC